jgi:hypothetical protein
MNILDGLLPKDEKAQREFEAIVGRIERRMHGQPYDLEYELMVEMVAAMSPEEAGLARKAAMESGQPDPVYLDLIAEKLGTH